MPAVLIISSCSKKEDILEYRSDLEKDKGILRSVKYYNNNGELLFSKNIKCSISRTHDDESGILDITILDMDTKRAVDIQGNGTLIMEELPEELPKDLSGEKTTKPK